MGADSPEADAKGSVNRPAPAEISQHECRDEHAGNANEATGAPQRLVEPDGRRGIAAAGQPDNGVYGPATPVTCQIEGSAHWPCDGRFPAGESGKWGPVRPRIFPKAATGQLLTRWPVRGSEILGLTEKAVNCAKRRWPEGDDCKHFATPQEPGWGSRNNLADIIYWRSRFEVTVQ